MRVNLSKEVLRVHGGNIWPRKKRPSSPESQDGSDIFCFHSSVIFKKLICRIIALVKF